MVYLPLLIEYVQNYVLSIGFLNLLYSLCIFSQFFYFVKYIRNTFMNRSSPRLVRLGRNANPPLVCFSPGLYSITYRELF